ncbi:MAG: Wzz/FepE/Etk N-terminal domain-containing protein [Lachnospiraceae bacterium]
MEKDLQKGSMDRLFCSLRQLLENWWVLLCIGISTALLTYMVSSVLFQPMYTSGTTFVVSAKSSSIGTYANSNSAQKLTDKFQAVLDSQVLKKKVAQTLGRESFNGEVDITVLPETNLLKVSVTSNSPSDAYALLKGMMENYESVSKTVLGAVVLETFEEPRFPGAPNRAFDGNRMLKLGFAAGAAATAALIALYYFLRNDICTEAEISEKLDTTLFGVIHHERKYRSLRTFLKRQEKKLLMTEPAVSFEFAETMKKMRTKLVYHFKNHGSKVLLVTSAQDGEGKSLVAANLALSLAQRSGNVLLLEGDLRQSKLQAQLGTEAPKAECSGKRFSESGVKKYLDAMRRQMDYIIIDGPSVKGHSATEILAKYADCSLLVVRQTKTEVPFINDAIDMLNCYGEGVIGCVFNDVAGVSEMLGSGYRYGYGYGYGYGKYGYGKYGYGYGKYGYGSYGSRSRRKKSED